MDFDLSEEQRLLKESIDGLLGSSYEFEQRKKYMAEKGGWSKSAWNKLAEQGLLGLPFSEDDGGFGAGAVETMIVMEALGKALLVEPYLPTVVLAGGFRLLRTYRMSADEARMVLQEDLWAETRGEQRRQARWLAWARRRANRAALVRLTGDTLAQGLALLGIAAPDSM